MPTPTYDLIEEKVQRESLLPAYDFYPMADLDPWTGCWIWKGSISKSGYGIVSVRGETRSTTLSAHRVSMYIKHGNIPEGMVVDHKCHVDAIEAGTCKGGDTCMHRRCVNPDHLRFLTANENSRHRTWPETVKKKNIDTCQSGRHAWVEENIRIQTTIVNGKQYEIRGCKKCGNEAKLRWQREKREKKNPNKRSREYWGNTHCPKGHERTEENTATHGKKLVCRLCRNESQLKRYYARKGRDE